MFGRVASRLVTGPLAFLVAGILDLLSYWRIQARRIASSTISPR